MKSGELKKNRPDNYESYKAQNKSSHRVSTSSRNLNNKPANRIYNLNYKVDIQDKKNAFHGMIAEKSLRSEDKKQYQSQKQRNLKPISPGVCKLVFCTYKAGCVAHKEIYKCEYLNNVQSCRTYQRLIKAEKQDKTCNHQQAHTNMDPLLGG